MKSIYLQKGEAVQLLDPDTGRAVAVSHMHSGVMACTILSGDSKQTASASCDQHNRVFTEDTSNQRVAMLQDASLGEQVRTLLKEKGYQPMDGDPLQWLKRLLWLSAC